MQLPKLYSEYLNQYFDTKQLLLLEMLVCQLQIYKKMTIEGLATHLVMPILLESKRERIQRFLKLEEFSEKKLWLGLIKKIIQKKIPPRERIYLAIDRTQWKDRNIFYIGIIIDKRAYPIIWEILSKKGASNLEEQKKLIRPVIEEFKESEIVILGDREFHGVELAKWLDAQGVIYVLREKKELQIKEKGSDYQRIDAREIKPGIKEYLTSVTLVKERGFEKGNVIVYWKRQYRGKGEKEAWYLLTNLASLEEGIEAYQKRMGIEEMFKDFKKGGYNLEDCQASEQRLNALLTLIAIAYTISSLKGKKIKSSRQAKYVGRQRNVKNRLTQNSYFKLGLYGQIISNSSQILHDLAQKLMNLTPQKRLFYLKGIRAINLIQHAF